MTASIDWPISWDRPTKKGGPLRAAFTFIAVTPEQMHELNTRLVALLAEFPPAATTDPSVRRVSVSVMARPLELDRPPEATS